MKRYGFNFATEFTRKQVNVIFAKAKSGEIKVEEWFIQRCYKLADYYGYDDSRTIAAEEEVIKQIIEYLFAGKIEEAQEKITYWTEVWFNATSKKYQAKMSREFVK